MFRMTRIERSKAARALLGVAAVVVLGGCATKGDIRDLQTEVRALSARQDSLITRLLASTMSTQDTVRTQSNQLFDFRGEITQQLRLIAERLETLEALAGENQRGIRALRDQVANMRAAPASRPTVGTDPGDQEAGDQSVGGAAPDAGRIYETAMSQYGRGSLNTARMAFEELLSSHPNDELAPDAHYFLADILYQQGDLDAAMETYREIPTRFPTAERVPMALYRIALIQIEQEDLDDARETLERILNTYADSDVALLAQDKLAEIGG